MENDNSSICPTSCKVVLLGESGVGKTSIISRYISSTFSANLMSTSGVNFANKVMYFDKFDTKLKFEIWDTAGQEKFRSLTKIFYTDTSIAVLVYDITKKQTFNEIKNYWINEIKENTSKHVILAIAANKADMYEEEEVEEKEGRALAKEYGGIFQYTSAKNGIGIDEIFKEAGSRYIDPSYDGGGAYVEEMSQRSKMRILKNKGQKKECCS